MVARLKYTLIRNREQYNAYCETLEALTRGRSRSRIVRDEIDLLTLLISKWDEQHGSFADLDPVKLLQALMKDHQLKAKDLAALLGVSKGYVSDMLNYKKGFSKETIRTLSLHFKMNQAAFNRPYVLVA